MRSVFKSSPPGAPRSIVSALSIPRPAYMAAHSPAGPAPTMITSYSVLVWSAIGHPFSVGVAQLQPGRIGGSRERSGEPLPEPNCFELDIGPLGARQLLERRPADDRDAMPIPPPLVEQRGCPLDQPLPNTCRRFIAVPKYRTPDGFQGLVGEPVLAGVEQVACARQDRLTLHRRHGRQKAAQGGRGGTGTTTAARCRPLPPLSATCSALHDTS